ncbi:polysaccharide pyruvyl transferase CsaB [Candidatus Termititenax aidoneus]|uniref:Polysaccharide pyruvyl transferase CsaB n=1 Tax=Termititenax aidoneus TaxID=2218524 RepID=A0A388T7I7_TERA1|nr:polysaccharide pyruvyl transferase CsaB [Candidatus Termititenax aidoneus]
MKILLAGYYGFGNLGDELLAQTARELLSAKHTVTVCRARRNFLFLLLPADCLLLAGGSLFQDVTGRGLSVLYYSAWACAAKLFRKKLFLVAQGIGPIRAPLNRWLTRAVFRRADFVSLRDRESAEFLGLPQSHLTADLLFAAKLRTLKTAQRQQAKTAPLPVGAARRRQARAARRRQIIVNLKKSAPQILTEFQPVYLAMQPSADWGRPCAPPDFAAARLAVGMRLHFLILAVLHNVPAVGIAYDPKVENFCRKFDLPYVTLDELERLPQIIRRELAKPAAAKKRLAVLVKQERRLAREGVKVLLEKLNG